MRIDDYLSTVGVVKRRTVAKELTQNGLVEVGDRKVKPAYQVKVGDIIRIKGSQPRAVEVLALPGSSVSKEQRGDYFRDLPTA